jgi:hypothetical protein
VENCGKFANPQEFLKAVDDAGTKAPGPI